MRDSLFFPEREEEEEEGNILEQRKKNTTARFWRESLSRYVQNSRAVLCVGAKKRGSLLRTNRACARLEKRAFEIYVCTTDEKRTCDKACTNSTKALLRPRPSRLSSSSSFADGRRRRRRRRTKRDERERSGGGVQKPVLRRRREEESSGREGSV